MDIRRPGEHHPHSMLYVWMNLILLFFSQRRRREKTSMIELGRKGLADAQDLMNPELPTTKLNRY